jgi:hypothetical protein
MIDYYALSISLVSLVAFMVCCRAWFGYNDYEALSFLLPFLYTFIVFLMIACGVVSDFATRTLLGRAGLAAIICVAALSRANFIHRRGKRNG